MGRKVTERCYPYFFHLFLQNGNAEPVPKRRKWTVLDGYVRHITGTGTVCHAIRKDLNKTVVYLVRIDTGIPTMTTKAAMIDEITVGANPYLSELPQQFPVELNEDLTLEMTGDANASVTLWIKEEVVE